MARRMVLGWVRWLWGACGLAALGACGGGSNAWGGVIADSAGVVVVANPETGLWQAGEGWDVREELTIGRVEGNPDYLFGSIAGVCVSSGGDVIVLDRQAATVRVFDPDGVLVRTFGGPGSGPGELSNTLSGCWVGPGDTVAVPDLQLSRVTRYSLAGDVVRATPFEVGTGIPIRWSMFPDGRLIAQIRFGLLDPSQLGEPDALVAELPGGPLADTLLELPASGVIVMASGRPRYTLLAPQPIWTLDPDAGIWVYGGGGGRLVRYGAGASPTRIVTRALDPVPASDLDRAMIAERVEATYPAALVANVLGGINVAPTFPFVFALAAGPDGTLWAQRYRAPSSVEQEARREMDVGPRDAEVFLADVTLRLGSRDWDVFDAEGRYLGAVTFPEGFEAFEFDGDAVYGVWRDPMGVEFVKRLRVVRNH